MTLDSPSVKNERFAASLRICLLALLGIWPGLVSGATVTPSSASTNPWTQRVEQLALQAARAATAHMPNTRVEVEAGALDPRLKLAPCEQVDVYLPPGHKAWGSTRVGLRCVSGPTRWSVFMPLTVRVFAPAIQAASELPSGTVLRPEHLRIAETEWSAVDSPAFTREQAVVGRSLVRSITAGQALRETDLKKRQWFAVGDVVRVVAVGDGFSISGEGVALTPGIEGQPARIRTESGRTVTGSPVGDRRMEASP